MSWSDYTDGSIGAYGMSGRNCTAFPTLLPANPDISGIGVLTGFMATAYLTWACCVSKAAIDYQTEKGGQHPKLRRWSHALQNTITVFSDQQVVTGIGVLIAGFAQLEWGIASYHWVNIVNLAWFSAMTHLLTLSVMRHEIQSRKTIRLVRVVGMGILVVLLLCAQAPIGYVVQVGNGFQSWFPAWCLYHPNVDWLESGDDLVGKGGTDAPTFNWPYVLIASYILLFGYVSRARLLYTSRYGMSDLLPRIFRIPAGQPWNWIEQRLDILTQRQSSQNRLLSRLEHRLLYTTYLVLYSAEVLYKSSAWEITWLSLALAWGTIRVFRSIYGNGDWIDDDYKIIRNQQNIWGFGQVVAVSLLVLPLMGFFDAYITAKESENDPKSPIHPPARADTLAPPAMKRAVTTDPWFSNLVILWYANTLSICGLLLYLIPGKGAEILISCAYGAGSLIEMFACWIVFSLAFLWISAITFGDRGLRAWTSKPRLSKFFDGLIMSAIVFASLAFYLWTFFFPSFGKFEHNGLGGDGFFAPKYKSCFPD